MEYHPYEHPPARVCPAGRRRELEEVELEDLLSILDEAEELTRAGGEPGNCWEPRSSIHRYAESNRSWKLLA